MELRHLRYFVAAAEQENVSRAALKLHVSQPGISRQIHDLEEELGFSLFERSAKALKLTVAGRKFLEEARAVLQRVDQAVKNARAVAMGADAEIHVGYAPSLTIQILPRALRAFQSKFPAARVSLHDLSTEEMLAGLRSGELQVALMVRPPRKMLRGLQFQELARYPIYAALPPKHPLTKSKTVSVEQLSNEPLIAYSRRDYPEYHGMLEKLFSPHKPHIVEEHDGVTSIIAAVESGRGIALVPQCVQSLAGPRVTLLPLDPAPDTIPVGATWKDSAGMVKKFVGAAAQT
ncbi:MAG TPA: LysR substrate-binding domain-containing protein [Candidatus Acidoferrales bacterium]|jgi:DNA-binding transcriptional LysR family regulator|nr:LysR substrate-binding domain-containing protein [Candidatus Acidoferrales bacterium]